MLGSASSENLPSLCARLICKKGKDEPLLFARAHLAAADRLSAEIRGLFSRVNTRGG